MAKKRIIVSMRLDRRQAAGLRRLAQELAQTRSKVMGLLLDNELERRQVQDGIAQALAVGRTDG